MDYSTIFTEPEANNCFSIISELNKNNGLEHKNMDAIVRLHTRMQPYSVNKKLTCKLTSIVNQFTHRVRQ